MKDHMYREFSHTFINNILELDLAASINWISKSHLSKTCNFHVTKLGYSSFTHPNPHKDASKIKIEHKNSRADENDM